MQETATKKHPITRDHWLRLDRCMVRLVTGRNGEDELEEKPLPNSVRRRTKRRSVDAKPQTGV